ncbi:MAG: LptF/LptG family permease [Pseudomonadota bacterium]
MSRVDRYLMLRVLLGCALVGCGLLAVYLVLAMVAESSDAGRWSDAAREAVLSLPLTAQRLAPALALFGGLAALAPLVRRNELTALLAAGCAPARIARGPLLAALLLGLAGMANSQWLVPPAARSAAGEQALWLRAQHSMVHIGRVGANGQLADLSLYDLEGGRLRAVVRARGARYDASGHWQLQDARRLALDAGDGIRLSRHSRLLWRDAPPPQILRSALLELNAVGLLDLARYVAFLRASQVNADAARTRLLRLLMQPLLIAAMILLGVAGLCAPRPRADQARRLALIGSFGIGALLVDETLAALGQLGLLGTFTATMLLPLTLLLLVALRLAMPTRRPPSPARPAGAPTRHAAVT